MARIRTIKPEFWQDEKLAALDPITRLVFLGLISMADDAGRLVDNVKSIDGFVFPETDDSSRESLEILARLSRIIRYTSASGQRLLQVANWDRHQKVDHPNKYVLPAPLPEDMDRQPVATGFRKPREKRARPSRKSLATTNDLLPTTNDQRPEPGSADADPPAPRGGWPARFAKHLEPIGLFPIPRVGKALDPIVQRYGEARAEEMVVAYGQFAPHLDRNGVVQPEINQPQFCSPEKLRDTAGFWFDYTAPLKLGGAA